MELEKTEALYIIEIFSSIQGETSLAGLPTAFIRLAACNLRCSWCDTSYSFGRGDPITHQEIQEKIKGFGCQYVCVTGGEPLLQKSVHPLMRKLSDEGYHLSLETGGSLSIEDVDQRVRIVLDIKCPGSKMSHKNHWRNLDLLRSSDEIKFVILDRNDYLFANKICLEYQLWNRNPQVLYSPVHGALDPKVLVGWILEDKLPVRLNLQIHKYIWSAYTRGV